jgi:B9 domain-containing protein 1
MSQIAASNGKKIVWNIPFDISFETTFLAGWPQMIVILYGTDFFGRSLVRGYGNVHLPSTSGIQNRKIRVFQPLPQSTLSGMMGYI